MVKENASNLTLIIQGPFNDQISENAQIYRKEFPLLEILIISWEEDYYKYKQQFPENSEKIKVITAKDPGGDISSCNEKFNVNRQLVSTKKGLQLSNTEYCLKTRSDFTLNLNLTIKKFNKFNRSNDTNTEFNESILILNLTSENPLYSNRYFAFCDWLYLGLTDDLKKLIISDQYPKIFLKHKIENNSSLRYNAEQWMVLKGLLGQNFLGIIPNSYAINESIINSYMKVLRSFIILNPRLIGLNSHKYHFLQFKLSNMYTYKEWKSMYYESYNYSFDIERILYNIHGFLFKIKKIIS
tara:strand:- start:4434 stop:5327 length:894 start_codon:yes stop_codon:yes gene_type:complete